jgi:CreA protein
MTQGWKVKWGAGFAAALVVLGLLVHWHHVSEKRNILSSVNTEFKLIGPDHKIIIESYDVPKIDGVTVFISKSQTGGIKGALGRRRIRPTPRSQCARPAIKVKETFDNGEDAFTEKRSVLFKRLHVSRFWDAAHKSFVYVVWTDRFINGSPPNSISAVVAEPGGTKRLICR